MTNVAVVGNGILGLSVAESILTRAPEAQVAVVGPRHRLGGASAAAGAMLGVFGETTEDSFRHSAAVAKFELSRSAASLWEERLTRLHDELDGDEVLHHVEGTHLVLNSVGGELDTSNYRAVIHALSRYGESWEDVEPGDVPGLQPRPDSRALRAVFIPNEDAVDGTQVLRLMERRVVKLGGKLVDAEVGSITPGRSATLALDRDTMNAGQVVIAAGAASRRLLAPIAARHSIPPLLAGAGQAVVARRVLGAPFESVVRTPNRSGSCGLHAVPLAGTHEYFGATNVVFAEPEPDSYLGVGHFLVDCASTQLDERVFLHRLVEWRMGNRPVSLDGFPLIGWTDVENVYLASGTYRDGFLASPLIGEHVAAEVLGEESPWTVPFNPMRTAIRSWTVDESVEAYARHMVAGWYENRAHQPRHVTTDGLADLFRREARELYVRLQTDIGLGPDILMFLLASRKDPADVDAIAEYLQAVSA